MAGGPAELRDAPGLFGAIDVDGNEFLNLHGRAGDVRLVASAPALPDVPDVVVRDSLPPGMPPIPSA